MFRQKNIGCYDAVKVKSVLALWLFFQEKLITQDKLLKLGYNSMSYDLSIKQKRK